MAPRHVALLPCVDRPHRWRYLVGGKPIQGAVTISTSRDDAIIAAYADGQEVTDIESSTASARRKSNALSPVDSRRCR